MTVDRQATARNEKSIRELFCLITGPVFRNRRITKSFEFGRACAPAHLYNFAICYRYSNPRTMSSLERTASIIYGIPSVFSPTWKYHYSASLGGRHRISGCPEDDTATCKCLDSRANALQIKARAHACVVHQILKEVQQISTVTGPV
jgi:hypothetical protein